MKHDVRIQTFASGMNETSTRPLRLLGFIGAWAMVRRHDFPDAMPFVVSKKDWERMPKE